MGGFQSILWFAGQYFFSMTEIELNYTLPRTKQAEILPWNCHRKMICNSCKSINRVTEICSGHHYHGSCNLPGLPLDQPMVTRSVQGVDLTATAGVKIPFSSTLMLKPPGKEHGRSMPCNSHNSVTPSLSHPAQPPAHIDTSRRNYFRDFHPIPATVFSTSTMWGSNDLRIRLGTPADEPLQCPHCRLIPMIYTWRNPQWLMYLTDWPPVGCESGDPHSSIFTMKLNLLPQVVYPTDSYGIIYRFQ